MFENTHTIFAGRNAYGERGEFHGGDIEVFLGGEIEVFFWAGDKVLRGKKTRVQSPESRVQSPESRVQSPESRVQSPESRVQSPGSSPAFRICQIIVATKYP